MTRITLVLVLAVCVVAASVVQEGLWDSESVTFAESQPTIAASYRLLRMSAGDASAENTQPSGGDGKKQTSNTTASSLNSAPSLEDESAPCYVYALDAPCVAVGGLDATFLTESVPIMLCESRGRPWAISATDDHGLLQLNVIHRARALRLGFEWSMMLDPLPNLTVAEAIWLEQGFRPWSCYR